MTRILLLFLCGVSLAAAETAMALRQLALQPLGPVKAEEIKKVKSGIEMLYEVTVVVLPEKPLPRAAYFKPRDRYKADLLLEALEKQQPEAFAKIIGLTARDISVTNDEGYDWGIFGLGQLGGSACVVSTFRLRAGKADDALFFARLVKVVNHEVGHTFGLDHCPQERCLMEDVRGKIATVDASTGGPCEMCAATLPIHR
jgi:archaemetzincin